MGMFDYLIVSDEIKLEDFPDHLDREFQTKTFSRIMKTYKINNDGHLLMEEVEIVENNSGNKKVEYNSVFGYDKKFETKRTGWTNRRYSGVVRFKKRDGKNGNIIQYSTNFDHGKLISAQNEKYDIMKENPEKWKQHKN